MAGEYTKKDAAEDTDTSTSKVSEAWHDARDAAAEEGGWNVPEDRHGDDADADAANDNQEENSGSDSPDNDNK